MEEWTPVINRRTRGKGPSKEEKGKQVFETKTPSPPPKTHARSIPKNRGQSKQGPKRPEDLYNGGSKEGLSVRNRQNSTQVASHHITSDRRNAGLLPKTGVVIRQIASNAWEPPQLKL